MFDRLLPQHIDNVYIGHPVGPWLFGLVVAARTLQGLSVTFATASVAKSADGIPLDTFSPSAAQTVVTVFALSGVYRLALAALCVVVLVRYRSAVPLMFAVLALESFGKLALLRSMPFPTTGSPPGPHVNLTLAALIVAGLVLALWPRQTASAQEEGPPSRSLQ